MFRRWLAEWGWLLILFTLAGVIETVFWGQMQAFMPLYLPRLGLTAEQVPVWTGVVTALSAAAGIPFLPLWGALADRYARQPIIVRSFAVYLVAGLLTLLARNIWVFLLGRAVMSLAMGNTGLMMTTLSERAPKQRLGLAFALMSGASPLGAFLGPLMGGPLVDRWGFPAVLAFNCAAMLVVILGLSFGYRDDFKGTARGPLLGMAWESVRLILRTPRLWTLFVALFVLFAGWMLAFTYMPLAVPLLYSGADVNTTVGLVMGAGGLATLLLGPAIGALADKFGHWRVLLIGAVVMTALWPWPALMRDWQTFAAAVALINGVTSGVFAVSFTVLSGSAASEVRGRVMSFAYLPVNVGTLIGPALGSWLTQWGVMAVFPAAAVMTALGWLLLLLAKRTGAGGLKTDEATH